MKQADDICFEYNGEDRRKHCELVVVVNQKFKDFMEETRDYRDRNNKSMEEISSALALMREEVREIRRPYKALIWITSIVSGVFLLEISQWLISAIKNRIHP